MRKILFILFFISIISIPYAAAHPFTLETNPSSSQNGLVGTTEVFVVFSEPVEIDFSDLKVFDSNGEQIDNRDTQYYQGEDSLIITTPPLQEGVYTVTTKVLSKVDGHLVPSAFVFAVGDIQLDITQYETQGDSETIFFPEAGARFPGLVGQTIVLGAVIASLLIWGTQNKELIKTELGKINSIHHGKLMSITGVGLVLVFVSNITMLAVQSLRLETSALDAIQTTFGTSWLIRMGITIVLLGTWFWLDRNKKTTKKNQVPMLVLSLALIGTTSIIGHGAASGEIGALILDYIHNLVAAIWIGGLVYFVFTLLPTLSHLDNTIREKITLVMIPRFSIVFVIALGIVIITGPTLMWFLESDVGLITESTYGKLIFAKIAIASVMVGLGGYFQFKVQKSGEAQVRSGSISVHKKLKRTLKFDVVLGIALLGVVAILANGTLPAGEIQKVDAQEVTYDFRTIEFTENAKFDIEISPFTSGNNAILVKVSDTSGNPLPDSDEVKVKFSNPERAIAPIEVAMEKIDSESDEYKGELTFGFSGKWQVEVEAQRTENANEIVLLNLLVKPRLPDLKVEIVEYELPEASKPLYPLYDGDKSIYISDPSAPKLWRFDLETKEFESFSFNGLTTMLLTKDSHGKIWFTDTPSNNIGYFDPISEKITTIGLPEIQPILYDTIPTFILADYNDNIWAAITNKDVILKYDQNSQTFEQIKLPVIESLPFTLGIDLDGNIWFTESGTGRIGVINPANNEIKEFEPEPPLASPESLLFDDDGTIWIGEHTGVAIARFDPVLETFERIPVPDPEALPYGMSFDRYGNVWVAQHTVDTIVAYDPDNKNMIEVPIPTETSFVQFTTADDKDDVWFVEQQGNKLGMVKLTEIPTAVAPQIGEQSVNLKYTEIVSPLIAMGIIATSLFFVKNVKDKRRLNSLVMSSE